ncbi:MAG TPA: type I polyketide synthase, partial [Streptosporangiaceae bacterium]|nr:type I polyketide synthase [Streptosporangiaceae bacterium]
MSGAWSGPSGDAIAIVGADCRYPDAENPDRLWETVLARRRAFRPIPHRRLNLHDYADADPGDGGGAPDPDRTYARFAAVLAGWRFDRARFRVPGPAYRVTDTAHWLALDVAANALVSAGYPDARGLDRDRTGVVIGNTMTGEFSRAAALRLRWPYVRRVLGAALAGQGWQADRLADFLGQVEKAYKEPFPAPNDESLAGGLANTIAGRICNHFGLRGGGHTVDGACSSSLLAIITACSTLLAGDADIMLAGGVDVSLDPFELVGFARTGALATSDMRVYDAAPTGFWPGEGCGVVVLMRAEDAIARGRTPLGLIRGWGISSDGKGGITRPDLGGELLALERAYERAGFGPETVSMFEGHGTGTAVGDETEISALIAAQRDRRTLPPAALGSIKANIGHTKAAAGVAGLLKAALALRHQILPPTTGCAVPHELLRGDRVPLRIVRAAEPWPAAPLRAAVSAMGFGGINSHVVLEAATRRTRTVLSAGERRTARRPLSHELFVFGGDTTAELVERLARVADAADVISMAEHADLAADLAAKVAARMAARAAAGPGGPLPFRVGIAARDPAQLARYARKAANDLARLARSAEGELIVAPGTFAARGRAGRVGLLFTGQGAPVPATAGALGSVVTDAEDYFRRGRHGRSAQADPVDTAAAQPAIFNASMAGLRCLSRLGVEASVAAGHSVGEITALCWAGALSEGDAYRLVAKRGQIMSQTGRDGTGMAAIAAPPEVVADLIEGTDVVIAADNGASQVVAGDLTEIDRVLELAKERGHGARRLQVSHAFHSPAMRGAVRPLARYLDGVPFEAIGRRVHSTITGRLISAADDLSRMLADQISSPVLFRAAVAGLADECDLLVEVGPGHGLAGLVPGITDVPAVALNAGGASAEDLCLAAAALYATGAMTDVEPWFAERFHRPFELSRDPEFLESPCEQGTASPAGPAAGPAVISAWHGATGDVTDGGNGAG